MENDNRHPGSIGFSKSRFEALTDGIFAIAMTLLVLGIAVPADETIESPGDVIAAFHGLLPDLINYAIAFFILHGMWVSHHLLSGRMAYINRRFLNLNLWLLMTVCLIPFTTSFSGDYIDVSISAIALEGNLLIVGLILYFQWVYVVRTPHLLSPDFTPADLSRGMRKSIVTPAVSLLGIALALVGITWSMAAYLLIPVIFRAMAAAHREGENKGSA